ncbi:MAG TPA: GNAT family N-acetyltransferase [Anaerolineales bacterium]
MDSSAFTFHPVTPKLWDDFETLFGERGAVGGCWCMWFRLKRSQFDAQKGEQNKQSMHAIINSGEVPGILAYDQDQPVGWCSVAPREAFPVLDRSWVLKRVDDQLVWSVVCFFIAKDYRQRGLSGILLQAALAYARENGARIVEGYPVEPKNGSTPDIFAFTGLARTFLQAGFVEVARRSETRPLMRYYFDSPE